MVFGVLDDHVHDVLGVGGLTLVTEGQQLGAG
jgi:hypothetical protein